VARHAGATRVDVDLVASSDSLMLRVADDGIGLPTPPGEEAGQGGPGGPGGPSGPIDDGQQGRGLRNMADRARQLGGRLRVIRPDRGTTLEWVVPIPRSRRAARADPSTSTEE
jgi:signal transduction histidine kinase